VVVLTLTPRQPAETELVQAIAMGCPGVRIVALTLDPAPHFLRELLAVGAHGCLNRESSATELVEAIRTVMAGKTYLSPRVDAVLHGYTRPARAPLAPREREVLARIGAGDTTKEIARSLGVGTKTVETHRRRLMHKLGRHSVAELTKYAVLEGLTPLEPA
jgi:DNA-binding NarL/FixJ family response regulator